MKNSCYKHLANADVVILDSCCSPSLRVDNLYKILSTPGTTKTFHQDYADTVLGSYYVDPITECQKSWQCLGCAYGTWLERW